MGYFGIAILSVVLRNTATGQNYEYLWGCEHNNYSFIIRTQIQEHLFFSCIFCESSCYTFFQNIKGVTKAQHTTYVSKNHIYFIRAILLHFHWCFQTAIIYCVLLSCQKFLCSYLKVLACFAQFSQIEQWNIILMSSGNDGKSRQEITIFIQYLGFNLG